jgi:carbamoyl-phosphate synthase large subunit
VISDGEVAVLTVYVAVVYTSLVGMIAREKPDAILPTLGGQTALNLAMALDQDGTLERLGVELIGANADAISTAEDRSKF